MVKLNTTRWECNRHYRNTVDTAPFVQDIFPFLLLESVVNECLTFPANSIRLVEWLAHLILFESTIVLLLPNTGVVECHSKFLPFPCDCLMLYPPNSVYLHVLVFVSFSNFLFIIDCATKTNTKHTFKLETISNCFSGLFITNTGLLYLTSVVSSAWSSV